jgi:hypothetical protein
VVGLPQCFLSGGILICRIGYINAQYGLQHESLLIRSFADLEVGFQFAEIKPVTSYGFRSFNAQVARWKLPGPAVALTYDYKGTIYYGFPW